MESLTLQKGKYLAPHYNTYALDNILVGVTKYNTPVETGQWHRHENCLLSYVLFGGNLELRKQQQIERTSGSANFYQAYEPHQNIYKQFPSKHISLEISQSFLQQHHISIQDLEKLVQQNHLIGFTFTQILKELLLNDHLENNVEMLVLELIAQVHQITPRQQPLWIKMIKEILHDRWNEQVTLDEMAQQAGVYPSSISKHFRKYFGCTLGRYTRQLRVTKAIEMMQNTRLSLTEIAYSCGFSDQSHFIRVFRQVTGFNPKKFRKL